MPTLHQLSETDPSILGILSDTSMTHAVAAAELTSLGYPVTRHSVRRSRETLAEDLLQVSESHTPTRTLADRTGELTAVVIGDYQIGVHDRGFIDRQCEIIRDIKPDLIISTGDELDFTSLSRYARGMADQFGRTIHQEREMWMDIAQQINEVAPYAEKRMCDSNHLRRLPAAINQYMPGVSDLPELFLPNFLHLEELGWHWDQLPYEVLPNVVYSHGDDWGVTSRGQSTKFREVIKTRQANVIFGHSHQAGLYTTALGHGFDMHTRWALNVGTGMRIREAGYIKSTSPDWSRGIGILEYDGEHTTPDLRLEINGRISVYGKSY